MVRIPEIKISDKGVDGYDVEHLEEVSIASQVLVRKMDYSTQSIEPDPVVTTSVTIEVT
jgi:molybdate-binding protein